MRIKFIENSLPTKTKIAAKGIIVFSIFNIIIIFFTLAFYTGDPGSGIFMLFKAFSTFLISVLLFFTGHSLLKKNKKGWIVVMILLLVSLLLFLSGCVYFIGIIGGLFFFYDLITYKIWGWMQLINSIEVLVILLILISFFFFDRKNFFEIAK